MPNPTQPPKWYWAVSGLGLIWNLLGVTAFFIQMATDLNELPDAERLFYEAVPTWATVGFAVAVASGSLGCLALLLKKSWAYPMLLLCIAGITVQVFHSLALSNGIEVFGPEGIIMPVATFSIAVLLTLFARTANRRGWTEAKTPAVDTPEPS